jgi:hypothetical protein
MVHDVGMASRASERRYALTWTFEPHIAADHLGRSKYTTSAKALAELVANGLAAGDSVGIQVIPNALGGVESIIVRDNGRGMSREELASRFVRIGVRPDQTAQGGLAKFGIGRLAVHRLGGLSRWSTVAATPAGRIRSDFELTEATDRPLEIVEVQVDKTTPTGTQIQIFNLVDSDPLTPSRIKGELLAQFASYLLAHPAKRVTVQDEALDVAAMVASSQDETLRLRLPLGDVKVRHILLKKGVDHAKFAEKLLFSAQGRTVASTTIEEPPAATYIAIVEAAYLDSIVSSNRESIIELDGAFSELRRAVLGRVDDFRKRLRAEQADHFLHRARAQAFYPFRGDQDAVSSVRQVLYDAMLEKVNEHAQLENMTKRQQAVVFKLLNRVLVNQNLLDVVEEVADLSDDDVERFRRVLERTTLESIVRLSSEVTDRLRFLDVLHELVYGDDAKHLRERTQLHKILEPNCWIFGPQFHLASSDKSFREVVRRHREHAGLPPVADDLVEGISGVADIPDLFLAANRPYPQNPSNHHLLVEIKAPRVSIGPKEIEQIKRYGRTVSTSNEFDKTSTRWDLFIVSSGVSEEAEFERDGQNAPYGCLLNKDRIRIWAHSWSEIIAKARSEMQLVKQHLELKSNELSASDYLRETFPNILKDIEEQREKRASGV